MGKVKQAIQEVEETIVSLVGDIPRSLQAVQKMLPELLKDNPYANDKELSETTEIGKKMKEIKDVQ